MLINFITNAVKYSAENGKIIPSLGKEQNDLLFSVRDLIPGIEASYIQKIFERCFRVPGEVKVKTGLDLAVSKDFVETQGGDYTIKIGSIEHPT